METDKFKNLYKERYKIEAKKAELKKNYNYRNANWGKLRITIQGATTLFLTNMKRIIKLRKKLIFRNIFYLSVLFLTTFSAVLN